MDKRIFLCVGGDSRQFYMSCALNEMGRVYSYGSDLSGGSVIPLAEIGDMHEKADVLVLPIIKGSGSEIGCSGGKKVFCTELSDHLKKGALVTGGRLNIRMIEYFSALGYDVADYFKREELAIKNCIPTAEGALQIAMNETGITIFGSRVLITGYGRTAKACANLFKGAGAQCAIAVRRSAAAAEAQNNGLEAFDFKELYGHIPRFDIIINTVPAMIFDRRLLKAAAKDTLFIDLASVPGGIDFEAARELNKRVVQALSLPGKVAPITSGKIIAETVKDILLERGK